MKRAPDIARQRTAWLLLRAADTRLADLLGHAWLQGMRDAKLVAASPQVAAGEPSREDAEVERLRSDIFRNLLEDARDGLETAFDLGSDPGNVSQKPFMEADAAYLILRIEEALYPAAPRARSREEDR